MSVWCCGSILQEGIKEGGYVCVKENVAENGFIVDRDDSSLTRSQRYYEKLFEQAGLHIHKMRRIAASHSQIASTSHVELHLYNSLFLLLDCRDPTKRSSRRISSRSRCGHYHPSHTLATAATPHRKTQRAQTSRNRPRRGQRMHQHCLNRSSSAV